jgi:hypothetical protein
MRWENFTDAVTERSMLDQRLAQPRKPAAGEIDPKVSEALGRLQTEAGWLSPDSKLALAKSGASQQAIDKAAELGARNLVDRNDPLAPENVNTPNWFQRNIYSKVKAASRWTTATLDFIPEFIQGGLAQLFDDDDDIDGVIISTSLGTMLEDSDKAGEGFFLGGEAKVKQAERARRYRGTVNGSAWTVGRQAANLVFLPNSKPYNTMSGLIDASILLKYDPTNIVTDGIKAVNLRKGGLGRVGYRVPTQTAEEAAELRKAIVAETGLVDPTSVGVFDQNRWYQWMTQSRRGSALTDDLWDRAAGSDRWKTRRAQLVDEVGEVEAGRVLDRERNESLAELIDRFTDKRTGVLKVDTDVILDMHNARSREELLAVMSPLWSLRSGSLPEDIRKVQSVFGGKVADRIGLTKLRKSKFFTTVPGAKIVVGGNDLDNRQAVGTIRGWARTLGFTAEEELQAVTRAINVFSKKGTAPDQNALLDYFTDTIGAALARNGVDQNFVDILKQDTRQFADSLRLYYMDVAGKPTDKGFWNFVRNTDLVDDADELQDMLDETLDPNAKQFIASPLTMVEMLDRTVYLPNIRELRRLTRSRFMNELLAEVGAGGTERLLPKLTTRATPTTVTKLARQTEIEEIGKNVASLKAARAELTKKMSQASKNGDNVDDLRSQWNEINDEISGLNEQSRELTSQGYVDEEIMVRRGTLRTPLALSEWYQQSLWKPLALATGGYAVRNTLDAQISMAMSGFQSVLNHPFKFIAIVTGKSARGTLIGEDMMPRIMLPDGTPRQEGFAGIIQKIKYGKAEFVDFSDELKDDLSFGLREQGLMDVAENRMWETNQWVAVDISQSRPGWLRAVGQNGNQIFKDPYMRLAAETLHASISNGATNLSGARARAVSRIVEAIKQNEQNYNNLRRAFENGLTIMDDYGRKTKWTSANWDTISPGEIDQILTQWANRVIVDRVQQMIGGQGDFAFMLAYNAVPVTNKGVTAKPFEALSRNLQKLSGGDNTIRVGDKVQINDDQFGIVTALDDRASNVRFVDEATGQVEEVLDRVATVQPIRGDGSGGILEAFPNRRLSGPAQSMIEKMPVAGLPTQRGVSQLGLPQKMKYEQLLTEGDDARGLAKATKGLDGLTDWFFGRLYSSVSKTMDRSPLFRQAYYKSVAEKVDVLSASQARKLVTDISESAQRMGLKSTRLGSKEARYVGSKDVWEKIVASSKRTTGPEFGATIEELDDYAKFVALDTVKTALYNAAEKNNLEDAMRIVAPFASAWREIISRYGNFMRTNPVKTYRQFQRVYTGLEKADPENDGRGFIYTDPVSGERMFKFPASGVLMRALTGVSAELQAPVKQLSQGISWIPALGPYGQIAVSKLAPNTPQFTEIVNFLLPYGRTERGGFMFDLTPGWIQKVVQALEGDPANTETQFYNTYIETLQAKGASGQYDLSNQADVEQLLKDSREAARVLMGFRALSQFLGPTAGTVDFSIPVGETDQYVSLMMAEFYKMQAEDYDSAVPNFIEKFGDDAMIYIAGKTRAVREGLEATSEFGEWELQNQGLLGAYPDVAAYLAPGGSDFSFGVWQRQKLTGERRTLTDREIISLAQERVGAAKYRALRLRAGAFPTEEQRNILRQYRRQLAKQYPGFPEVARFEVGKFPEQISQLEQAVNDSRASNNPVAESVRQYLAVRNTLLQKARDAGYVANTLQGTKGLEQYRDYLASIGQSLIRSNPDFGRIYDRLLAQEVEL